jgi:hypothetical protein
MSPDSSARAGGDTTLNHVRFGGSVGFGGVDFVRPPRIETVWVRLGGRKLDMDSTWPPSTMIRDTGQRPHGVYEGKSALLVPAPSGEANAVQEQG